MNTLCTIGYTGRTIDELAELARTYDAGIIDIRFSAYSRVEKWRKSNLSYHLQAKGCEYSHIRELGNINYDTDKPIEIAMPDIGCQMLWDALQDRSQIILCACAVTDTCHRKTVADMMAERFGVKAVHLGVQTTAPEVTACQQELF